MCKWEMHAKWCTHCWVTSARSCRLWMRKSDEKGRKKKRKKKISKCKHQTSTNTSVPFHITNNKQNTQQRCQIALILNFNKYKQVNCDSNKMCACVFCCCNLYCFILVYHPQKIEFPYPPPTRHSICALI